MIYNFMFVIAVIADKGNIKKVLSDRGCFGVFWSFVFKLTLTLNIKLTLTLSSNFCIHF